MSREGEKFIEDLNLYLISTGKSEKEIKEFIEEAEEHLILGEKEGKTVQDIFGSSPEEYAESIAHELTFDKKETASSILMIIFGVFIALFFCRIEKGYIYTSSLELILCCINYIITFILVLFVSRKFAFDDKKLTVSYSGLFVFHTAILVTILIFTNKIDKNIILNRPIAGIIIAVCAVITLIISLKEKTYLLFTAFIWGAPSILETYFNLDFASWKVYVNIAFLVLAIFFMRFESKRNLKS